jgi:BlaI family penicillinase repressor
MSYPPRKITGTELEILTVLWKKGASTIRSIAEVLYPGGGFTHYATVQSLLGRLEEKGFVQRDRRERPHRFEAGVGREEVIVGRLKALVDELCGGSFGPLLSHLVKARKLTAAERKDLRKLLDGDDAPPRKDHRRKV